MSSNKRQYKCKNNPNKFCYVCGEYIFVTPPNFTSTLQSAYRLYFYISPENLGESWTPNVLCNTCKTGLTMWMTGAKRYLSFDVPTIWRQPMCHEVDCYFCLTKIKQHGRHKTVEYAHVNSMSKPVPHSLSVKYPVCPKKNIVNRQNQVIMPNEKSELLASRLQERNLLKSQVKVTFYRSRQKYYAQYYIKKNNVCYCNDIYGLFKEFGEPYDPTEWRLFIDSN
ncbi:uncharacterized protein LOC126910234 [Daktulosphaira vitifoliae]|uniref:uncharacterized protein LOC126910234 n=1 Tax=Daktulosphaira vitifoliae TaxID=58002 RepID=UPI0021A9A8CF|nr:uncharacterized protein LOC126910234 [Daktulosphaira vitifoliae]